MPTPRVKFTLFFPTNTAAAVARASVLAAVPATGVTGIQPLRVFREDEDHHAWALYGHYEFGRDTARDTFAVAGEAIQDTAQRASYISRWTDNGNAPEAGTLNRASRTERVTP